jgi:hypothetical protein
MPRPNRPKLSPIERQHAVRIFTEKLGLRVTRGRRVVPCPFHPDGATPSLSIDLDQGLFYCHGACSAPKGGGWVKFLVKWEAKEGRTITEAEARRTRTRVGTLVSAQEHQRRLREEDCWLFLRVLQVGAIDRLSAIDRRILEPPLTEQLWPNNADDMDEADWDDLAASYHARSAALGPAALTLDEEWQIAREAEHVGLTPAALALYDAATASGRWTRALATQAARHLAALTDTGTVITHDGVEHACATAVMELLCPAPRSATSTSPPSPPDPTAPPPSRPPRPPMPRPWTRRQQELAHRPILPPLFPRRSSPDAP